MPSGGEAITEFSSVFFDVNGAFLKLVARRRTAPDTLHYSSASPTRESWSLGALRAFDHALIPGGTELDRPNQA